MLPAPGRYGAFDLSLDPYNPMASPVFASPVPIMQPIPGRPIPAVGPTGPSLMGQTPPVPGLFGGIGSWFSGQDMAGQGAYAPEDYRAARASLLGNIGASLLAAGQPMAGSQRAQILQGLGGVANQYRTDLRAAQTGRREDEQYAQQKAFDEYSSNPENLKSLGFNDNQITLLSKMPQADRVKTIEAAMQSSPKDLPSWVEVKTADGVYMVNQKDPTQTRKVGDVPSAPGTENQQFDNEAKLRTEYIKQAQEYQGTSHAYNRVQAAASDQSGASDVALVYGFMKMLDPTSAVREGEYATAEQTGGIPQQVTAMYNRMLTGERLSPEMRQNFVKQATSQYQTAQQTYEQTREMYRKQAQAYGLDPDRVAPDLTYGVQPQEQPRGAITGSARQVGVTQQQWDAMTPEERAVFP